MTTRTDIGQDRSGPEALQRPDQQSLQQREQDPRRHAVGERAWFRQSDGTFVNVGSTERNWSTYGGAALVALGLAKGRLGGLTLAALGGTLLYRGISGHCPMYSQLGKSTVDPERDAPDSETFYKRGIHVEQSITIQKPREELFRFWRELENLPRIMSHLDSVEVLDERRSRWHARGPAGIPLVWEAEISDDQPPQLLAWRTLPGAPVAHAGSVRFTPSGASTRIDVSLQYDPSGGVLTHSAASLMDADAGARIERDLREFKRAIESGRLAA